MVQGYACMGNAIQEQLFTCTALGSHQRSPKCVVGASSSERLSSAHFVCVSVAAARSQAVGVYTCVCGVVYITAEPLLRVVCSPASWEGKIQGKVMATSENLEYEREELSLGE